MCGNFAIFVAKLLNKYNETDPFKITEEVFGKDADQGDIEVLIDAFGKTDGGQVDPILDQLPQIYNGSGIKERLEGLWNFLRGKLRRNFPPSMRRMLELHGDKLISKIQIGRSPVQTYVQKALEMFRYFQKNRSVSHDNLFHLFMIIYLQDGTVLKLEKNQVLGLSVYQQKPNTEIISVSISGGLTISKMLETAIEKYGADQIIIYRGFNQNCQRFIVDLLESNGIKIVYQQRNWILQDVDGLVSNWTQKLLNKVTDFANLGNQLIEGHGDN
jgi:hypothetical protein